jgi:hypothetical protein
LSKRTSKLIISNSNLHKDGTGAQVQRIFSIAAYSIRFNMDFDLEPINAIEVQHGDSFKSEDEIHDYLLKLNRKIPDILNLENMFSRTELARYKSLNLDSNVLNLFFIIPILNIFSRAFNLKIRVLLTDAYHFTSRFPDSYALLKNDKLISEFKEDNRLNVQIHLRLSTLSEKSNRHVSPDFFLGWLNYITESSQVENRSIRLLVHTDCEVSAYDPGLVRNHLTTETENYWSAIGVTDNSGQLDVNTILLYRDLIAKIEAICPNYEIIFGLDPIEAWSVMAQSDVILTSKSSFSFIGALLSKATIVIAPEFEMKCPRHWIVGDYDFGYNSIEFYRLFSNMNLS